MSKNLVNDPEHWKSRAEEMRATADDVKDPTARKMMLGIAADYEKLAERAAKRADGAKTSN